MKPKSKYKKKIKFLRAVRGILRKEGLIKPIPPTKVIGDKKKKASKEKCRKFRQDKKEN